VRDLEDPSRVLSFAPLGRPDEMHAWKSDPAFAENMGALQDHVAEFTPSELELVAEV
jgi:hypothetical protein